MYVCVGWAWVSGPDFNITCVSYSGHLLAWETERWKRRNFLCLVDLYVGREDLRFSWFGAAMLFPKEMHKRDGIIVGPRSNTWWRERKVNKKKIRRHYPTELPNDECLITPSIRIEGDAKDYDIRRRE